MNQRILDMAGVCTLVAIVGSPITSSAQTAIPAPWTTSNIGGASPSGAATYDLQRFAISAGGSDIWMTSDQFRFVYQQVTGDVDVVARIDSFTAADPWSKVGVMVRADLSAGAANALATVTGSSGVAFQARPTADAWSATTAGPMTSAPYWVKISRVGTTITGYSAPDGGSWQKVGSDTVSLGASAYVGLAITSHNPGVLASAVVSQVSVTPRSLPSGQQTLDIGSPAIAGATSYSGGTYTITAAGIDIWGSTDQFRFVYQSVTGDVDVIARVNSLVYAHAWSKAGVMIRETLNTNSRHAMALMSAGAGYSFQWRTDPGVYASYVSGGSGTAPAWIRLVRTGTRLEAFKSTTGTSWTSMGSQTVSMASTVYVGLAVTSHNALATTTAVIDQLKIVPLSATTNQAPTVTLTSPASATAFAAPANVTVAASASDPENRMSRVEFYSNQALIGSDSSSPYSMTWSSVPAGTYSLTAKAFDADGGSAISPPVTIVVAAAATSTVPTSVIFQASSDHATLVTSYRLDVFASGANTSTATPVASANLGKPTPAANGDITVDEQVVFNALSAGSYQATVAAIGDAGESRSTPVTFVR
jgi:hypothetical protein